MFLSFLFFIYYYFFLYKKFSFSLTSYKIVIIVIQCEFTNVNCLITFDREFSNDNPRCTLTAIKMPQKERNEGKKG